MNALNQPDVADGVHSVRKSLKRLRAILRMLRDGMPDRMFREENRRLADAGRKISPWRDVHVQLQALGKLHMGRNLAGLKIRDDWSQREETIRRAMPEFRKAIQKMLARSGKTIPDWPLEKAMPRMVAAGMKRIYKKGLAAFKIAFKQPTPENLHEWRKKVKSLGYGLKLLDCATSKELRRVAQCTRKLGDALGEDHDLFMVLHGLRHENKVHPSHEYTRLAERIYNERTGLQKNALHLGEKVFDLKPRRFEKRLRHSLASRR